MSDMSGNLGAANLLKTRDDMLEARYGHADRRVKRARGLLMVLAVGLMLACGTAYASEPPSTSPAELAQNQVHRVDPDVRNANQGDEFFDWSIGIFAVILITFFTIHRWDSKRNTEE